MNLLINASNVRFGGGITVVQNLLRAVLPLRPQDTIYLLCPRHCGYEALAGYPNMHLLSVPGSFHRNYLTKLYYNLFLFRRLLKKYRIDKVISLGNIAFPSGSTPHLLLIQNAYLTYPDSPVWKRMATKHFMRNKLMNVYAVLFLKNASFYLLQTEIMRKRFCEAFSVDPAKTGILPNAVPVNHNLQPAAPYKAEGATRKLLFISKYYPHKNFEILLPLARMIRGEELPIRFTLTISEEDSADAAAFLKQVRYNGLNDIIHAVGHIPDTELPALYEQHDAVFLPTLLESFSGIYLAAMYYGKPVFTSDLDFAVQICQDAGYYFDPFKPLHIIKTIEQGFSEPWLMAQKVERGKEIVAGMPDWTALGRKFSEIIDTFE